MNTKTQHSAIRLTSQINQKHPITNVTTTNTNMEDEDIALAIRLMQQDAEQFVSAMTRKGKQVEGSQTDAQVAANLFLQDLMATATSFEDRRMARSVLQAIQTDNDTMSRLQNEEHVAQADRVLSLALSRGEEPAAVPQPIPETTYDGNFVSKLAYIYNAGLGLFGGGVGADTTGETAVEDQPESSAWGASRVRKEQKLRPCNACGDEKPSAELAQTPCRHRYCRECLAQIFQHASRDESLFPPRCCKQPIPLEENQVFLDANVIQEFRQKSVEFSTPRRTYCHNSRCGRFIPPANYANDTATCGGCGHRTCITCKGASHVGDCPNDEQLQQVIQLAGQQHWQRCQNCSAMVELNMGCNHITCRCRYEFCYVCGARWKTCDCAQWDEARLYERAAAVDARGNAQPAPRPAAVPQQNQDRQPVPNRQVAPVIDHDNLLQALQPEQEAQRRRIAELMEDLRENHECDHDRWFSRGGPCECEECGDVMPVFIYECRQCHIMACRYCRYHRL
ncbi:hypothetical protein F5Y04DRAFT_167402 [Hypomontagnella monticulosa]|nr:hypothetical protein F5Y04DRAFT_167402 [Hypomontagnella monticulosa]